MVHLNDVLGGHFSHTTDFIICDFAGLYDQGQWWTCVTSLIRSGLSYLKSQQLRLHQILTALRTVVYYHPGLFLKNKLILRLYIYVCDNEASCHQDCDKSVLYTSAEPRVMGLKLEGKKSLGG